MEKISIFNYEAFYLDFLEGNLNEADTVLFLEFLEANPDLKMEDELLPSFSDDNILLDAETKENLKQHSEEETIAAINVEHFLIAHSEGILSEEKTKELNAFISGNSALEKEKALFSAVHFNADKSIVFVNKQSLKRKKALVLWPYYAAAASLMIAMLVWYSNSNGKLEQENLFAEKEAPKKDKSKNFIVKEEVLQSPEEKSVNQVEERSYQKENTPFINDNRGNSPKRIENIILEDEQENKSPIADNSPVNIEEKTPNKNNKPIVNSLENVHLQAISNKVSLASNETPTNENKDYASVYFSDVSNPIEPITSFVAKKAKTEVDFRRQKKTKTKPSSFYVKIGKFEFSRKKH